MDYVLSLFATRIDERAPTVPRPLEASRGTSVLLSGLILLACVLQLFEIPNRGIDPDELEHLHAAYCVWRGEVPYRDFFEHHAPALYYTLVPLLKFTGPELSAVWLGRGLMWCCGLGTLWLTGSLAARWAGEPARLLAMALLAWSTIFQAKAIELRPDVPAMLLLVFAVSRSTFATGGGSWRRFLAVGIVLGLATLFTQKAIVPAAAIGFAACLSRAMTRESESLLTVLSRVAVPIACGFAAVWGIGSLLFASAGAAGDFWQSTWLQLWIWPVRSNRWDHLRPTLAGDLTVWIAALFEIAAVLRRTGEPATWREQRGATAVVALCCIASLALVKATYPQYYLLWMPFLAALAAVRIIDWCARPLTGRALSVACGCGLLLLAGEVLLAERAFFQRDGGALSHLAADFRIAAPLSLGLACVAAMVALASVKSRWSLAVLLLAGLGMGYGVLRDFNLASWSNREQVAAIAAVNRAVPTEGRVLDGFTGYGALRPHAWYYWWLNEYSLPLVPKEDLRSGLLQHLQQNPPAAVLFDENVARLPPEVLQWLRAHYEPAVPKPLWLPTQR